MSRKIQKPILDVDEVRLKSTKDLDAKNITNKLFFFDELQIKALKYMYIWFQDIIKVKLILKNLIKTILMNLLPKITKLLTFFIFFLLLFQSCNNEDLFYVDESTYMEEETEQVPNNDDTNPPIDLIDDNVETKENIVVNIEPYLNDLNLPDSITISHTNPSHGNLTIDDNDTPENILDDTFMYAPNGDFSGIDSFEYRVCDANNDENCDLATVTITINSVEEDIATELKAFPRAYGAGSAATGGRGGRVIHVTNLNDSGPGSLREAVMSMGPRIIVFDVSGTIELNTNLNILDGNMTIAGQTAPAGGITLTGKYIVWSNNSWTPNVNNIIMRYIKIRPNFVRNGIDMCLQMNNIKDVIVDHCSLSWGGDKAIAISDLAINITVQNSLIAECNTGMILGQDLKGGEYDSHDISCLRNIVYDSSHRFPNAAGGGRYDIINNVGYNYRYRLINTTGTAQLNVINNFYDRGTRSISTDFMQKIVGRGTNIAKLKVYTSGNKIKDFNPSNEWEMWTSFVGIGPGGSWSFGGKTYHNNDPVDEDQFRKLTAYSQLGAEIPILDTDILLDTLLEDTGANKYINADGTVIKEVDVVDTRYISNMSARNYVEYEWNENWASYPHYIEWHNQVTNIPINTRPAGFDTDKDGMPDIWETANNLDPTIDDSALDIDNDGYTNIEEYINLVDKI